MKLAPVLLAASLAAGCAPAIATLTEAEVAGSWRSPASVIDCSAARYGESMAVGDCLPAQLALNADGTMTLRAEAAWSDCRSPVSIWNGRWSLRAPLSPNAQSRPLALTFECDSSAQARTCGTDAQASANLCQRWKDAADGSLDVVLVNGAPTVRYGSAGLTRLWTRAR